MGRVFMIRLPIFSSRIHKRTHGPRQIFIFRVGQFELPREGHALK